MRVALLPLVACVALACGREGGGRDVASYDVTSRPIADIVRGAGTATARPACPPTGQWTQCGIIDRLDRAGLAPQLDSSAVPTEPPLVPRGFLVRMSRSEAEFYLYDDASARRRDEERIEKAKYLGYTEAVSMQTLPTLIVSSNAIVILHSRNDHQRERVGDAITAGPPEKP